MLADRRYCYPLTITDFASRYLARPKRFELLTSRFVVWCSS